MQGIVFQKDKFESHEIKRILNDFVSDWFYSQFKDFTEPQKYAIMNVHNQENTLVSAETGTGKTLSAFLAIINELVNLNQFNVLEEKVYCVYVSPLKALNNDIHRNLEKPLKEITGKAKEKGLNLNVRLGLRTGDTTATEKARMLKKTPHILITTPESLAIILNSPKFREKLFNVKWLIIDEIHSLAENKRGVHLSLSMERLQELSPELTRIGLSATIEPLQEITEFLAGIEKGQPRNCKIVNTQFLKKLDLKVISPVTDLVNITQERLHDALYNKLHGLIQKHKTTLVFTNTRSGTERVVHFLKDKFPGKYEGIIGAHHSSLSRDIRLQVEENLKQGKLKVVVCSTSLELGIDIGFIDLVVLIGSPKSVARAVQRIGRSGHKLHDEIKGRVIVLDRDDLIECCVLAKNALEKKLDKIKVIENALDVLAQQIYGIVIVEKRKIEDVFELIKQSYCYRKLKRTDFLQVIDYLSGKYSTLETRHVYAKIWHDEETGMIGKKGKLARVLYLTNIGTIPEESRIKVKLGSQVIGSIDERFMERLGKKDVFVLGGQSFEFKHSSGMTAQVKSAEKKPPTVPSWVSESLPLSFDLSLSIQDFRELMQGKFEAKKTSSEIIEFAEKYLKVENSTAKAVYNYFRQQYYYSELPTRKKLLIELFKEDNKRYLIVHALYGRRVNDALSRAIAYSLSRLQRKDLEISVTDNGFMIASNQGMLIEKAFTLLEKNDLRMVLEQALDKTEILSRRFRHCAIRALMILRSYKGKKKSVGRQQMSSRLLLSAVKRIDENFCILREAKREVLEDFMDIQNAEKVLTWIKERKIKVKSIVSELPSPFAFNILMSGHSDIIRMEDKLAFLMRVHAEIERKIKEKAGLND
ncbi:MAG: ATP-dependent helicase [archaeon]